MCTISAPVSSVSSKRKASYESTRTRASHTSTAPRRQALGARLRSKRRSSLMWHAPHAPHTSPLGLLGSYL